MDDQLDNTAQSGTAAELNGAHKPAATELNAREEDASTDNEQDWTAEDFPEDDAPTTTQEERAARWNPHDRTLSEKFHRTVAAGAMGVAGALGLFHQPEVHTSEPGKAGAPTALATPPKPHDNTTPHQDTSSATFVAGHAPLKPTAPEGPELPEEHDKPDPPVEAETGDSWWRRTSKAHEERRPSEEQE